MEKMNNLRDLLQHEIQDLYSAEEQIIAALPAMIEKASSADLKAALAEHLRTTESQKARLDQIISIMGTETEQKKGLFGLFGGRHKCKGMEGVLTEGKKVMGENMETSVMDAAIIACAQKVEHYEICGYGTARAYAEELGLGEVEQLLRTTLNEEYSADDKLTVLAESRINKQAERGATKSPSQVDRKTQRQSPSLQDKVRQRELEAEPVKGRRATEEVRENTTAKRGASPGRTSATSATATPPVSRTAGARKSGTAARSTASGKSTRSGGSSRGSASGRTR